MLGREEILKTQTDFISGLVTEIRNFATSQNASLRDSDLYREFGHVGIDMLRWVGFEIKQQNKKAGLNENDIARFDAVADKILFLGGMQFAVDYQTRIFKTKYSLIIWIKDTQILPGLFPERYKPLIAPTHIPAPSAEATRSRKPLRQLPPHMKVIEGGLSDKPPQPNG